MSDLQYRFRCLRFRMEALSNSMDLEDLRARTPIDRLSLHYITHQGYFCSKDVRLIFDDEDSFDFETQELHPDKTCWNSLTFNDSDYGRRWYIDLDFQTSWKEYDDSRKALLLQELHKLTKQR